MQEDQYMNQDQQDKDITEVVETTSNIATIESITKQDEIKLEELEEVVGGFGRMRPVPASFPA